MLQNVRLDKLNIALLLGLTALVATTVFLFGGVSSDAGAKKRSGGLNQTAATKAKQKAKAKSKIAPRFGARVLREGMQGRDVKVLKSIVRSKRMLVGSRVSKSFDRPTTSAVKNFQRNRRMRKNGVVNKVTSKKMMRSLRVAGASWYGPGFFGNKTACGQTLRKKTIGVAHKTLPCGSKVLIGYRGRYAVAKVIDRGPFIKGRTWDLTIALSDAIKFTPVGVGNVRHAVINRKK